MKTQTKALIASLIVVALGLSAVSGVTYSWWSDSENSEISIQTGYLRASTFGFTIMKDGNEVEGTPDSLPERIDLGMGSNDQWVSTAEGGRLVVCGDLDNLGLSISYNVKFEWSIPYKYNIDVSVPAGIESECVITDDGGNDVRGYKIDGSGSSNTITAGSKEYSVTLTVNKIPMDHSGAVTLKNIITQFDAPDYSLEPFQNHVSNQPYVINTAEELMGFAHMVNVKGWFFSGETVELGADIDLTGVSWTPIGQSGGGSHYNVGDGKFAGEFDGKGHTISNLNVDVWKPGTDNGKYYSSGLFGWTLEGGSTVIKNVTIDGAIIKGHHYTGAICGWFGGGTIEGCTVKNSQIMSTHLNDDACGDKVGGIVGYVENSNSKVVKNCSVKDTMVSGARDVGTVIGCYFGDRTEFTNLSADSVTIGTTTGCTHRDQGTNMGGGIVGRVS